MMQSERTKGPWRKGRDDMTTLGNEFDGEWCKYVYSGDPARAHTDTGVCTVLKAFGDTQEEAHGNARLAAAAVNAADDAGLSVDFLESGGVKEMVEALRGLSRARAAQIEQEAKRKIRAKMESEA